MINNICDVIVIVITILMMVEMFRNLFVVRNNKCEKDKIKIHLNTARILIVVIILIYIIYGMIRNFI